MLKIVLVTSYARHAKFLKSIEQNKIKIMHKIINVEKLINR